eukprot:4890730-Prymnesium_polylepis.1
MAESASSALRLSAPATLPAGRAAASATCFAKEPPPAATARPMPRGRLMTACGGARGAREGNA